MAPSVLPETSNVVVRVFASVGSMSTPSNGNGVLPSAESFVAFHSAGIAGADATTGADAACTASIVAFARCAISCFTAADLAAAASSRAPDAQAVSTLASERHITFTLALFMIALLPHPLARITVAAILPYMIANPALLRRFTTHGGRGTMTLWAPAPMLLLCRVDGFFFKELVPPYVEILNAAVSNDALLQLFSDWADMTGYDGETRKALTAWQKDHLKVSVPHLCVKSAIVAMGVNMANLMLGNSLQVSSNLATFYDQIRALAPPAMHEVIGRFAARKDDGFELETRDVDARAAS
jgi:hypothetical protein